MTDAALEQLRKELKVWQDTLTGRQRAAAKRKKELKRLSKLEAAARRRLHESQEAIKRARRAISKKHRLIDKRTNKGAKAALAWCRANLFVTENPAGSNRGGKITVWQQRLGAWLVGTPWCGEFVANALLAAGVKGVTFRLASVSLIEDDARAGRGPFKGWSDGAASARPGDLVVLFGRGVHVEIVREVRNGVLLTYGGNTSSGASGSQSNGGGSYPRERPFNIVRGIAHVRY